MHVPHALNILNSSLASTIRIWHGTLSGTSDEPPQYRLELFDREGSAKCRLVREALTDLNYDCMIYPCPVGGTRHFDRLWELSGGDEVPFLYDPNSGAKLSGVQQIIDYLFFEYSSRRPPNSYSDTLFNLFSSMLATQVRLYKGTFAKPARPAHEPLTLYSFESSPYSRPIRERLCELEIPYLLINLSKQKWTELGPAKLRMNLGDYKPVPGSKRDQFLQAHGEVQVPFLEDPNTGTELFESKTILQYLNETYAQ